MNRIHTLALVLLLGVLSVGTARADQTFMVGDLVCSHHSPVALIRFGTTDDNDPPVYTKLPRRIDGGLSRAKPGQRTDCTLPGGHKLRIRLGEGQISLHIVAGADPPDYFSLWIDKHIVLSRKQWKAGYGADDGTWIIAVVVKPGRLTFCTGPHGDDDDEPLRCTSQTYDLSRLRYDRVEYPADGSTPQFGALWIAKGAPDPALCRRYLASIRDHLTDISVGDPDQTTFAIKLSTTSPNPDLPRWPVVAETQIDSGGPSYQLTMFGGDEYAADSNLVVITPINTALAPIIALAEGLNHKAEGPWPAGFGVVTDQTRALGPWPPGWSVVTSGERAIYPNVLPLYVNLDPVRIDGRLYFLAHPTNLDDDPAAVLIGFGAGLKPQVACRINQVPVNYG